MLVILVFGPCLFYVAWHQVRVPHGDPVYTSPHCTHMTSPLVGVSLPVLADIMGRVTWFPFLIGVWSDQWVWASLVTLVYHFMVYLPLREASPAITAAQTFPSLEDEPTARQMYMIIMPIVAVSAALVGAIVRRLIRVPFHYVPIAHLIRSVWPIHAAILPESDQPLLTKAEQKRIVNHKQALEPISKRYSIYATVAFVVAVGGSLAAQEIYAWVHGGGVALDWLMAFLPLVLTTVFLIPTLFFDPHETYALFGLGGGVRTRALIAAGKIVACTALSTAIPQIVALYVRNVNVVILSGSMVIVGILLVAVLLSMNLFKDTPELYKGSPPRPETTHKGIVHV